MTAERRRPSDWSATWRDDKTGHGWTRDEAIRDLSTCMERLGDALADVTALREAALRVWNESEWEADSPNAVVPKDLLRALFDASAAFLSDETPA